MSLGFILIVLNEFLELCATMKHAIVTFYKTYRSLAKILAQVKIHQI